MKDKEAAAILTELLKKPGLSASEKEALSAAVGILSWTSLAESRLEARKKKRQQDVEW